MSTPTPAAAVPLPEAPSPKSNPIPVPLPPDPDPAPRGRAPPPALVLRAPTEAGGTSTLMHDSSRESSPERAGGERRVSASPTRMEFGLEREAAGGDDQTQDASLSLHPSADSGPTPNTPTSADSTPQSPNAAPVPSSPHRANFARRLSSAASRALDKAARRKSGPPASSPTGEWVVIPPSACPSLGMYAEAGAPAPAQRTADPANILASLLATPPSGRGSPRPPGGRDAAGGAEGEGTGQGEGEEGKDDVEEVQIPAMMIEGTPMMKVSGKNVKQRVFKLDPDIGVVTWESKREGRIPIESIKELRSGPSASAFLSQFRLPPAVLPRWLSIIYISPSTSKYKTLHLLAHSVEASTAWREALGRLCALRQALLRRGGGATGKGERVWMRRHWRMGDTSGDERLGLEEVVRLCRRLGIQGRREDIAERFKEADTQDKGYLDFAAFQRFVKLLKARPEIDTLWADVAREDGALGFDDFVRFMRETQKSTASTDDLQRVYGKYASSAAGGSMDLDGFATFLLSTENSVFADQHGKVHHYMGRPLPEYYVSSSHNTYLVGNQIQGDSTVEGYIRALLQGCRSVEIDVWDGDEETGPVVYHGRTLTGKVPLKDVLVAIHKYAFVASPYPVIISAETHCDLAQQDVMAALFVDVFGDALVRERLPGHAKEDLPSPAELKGRILLKTKNLYIAQGEPLQQAAVTVDAFSSSSEGSSDVDVRGALGNLISRVTGRSSRDEGEPVPSPKSSPSPNRKSFDLAVPRPRKPSHSHSRNSSLSSVSSSDSTTTSGSTSGGGGSAATKTKMSLALVALLVYTVGVKCRGFNKKERYAPEHMFSLSDRTGRKTLRQSAIDLVKHNRTHLTRIYPHGTRVRSGNYEPHHYWAAGCQLVALNWQTADLALWLNQAMFARNGRCGYVLKPEPLRIKDKPALFRKDSYVLEIKVISGQQLPRPSDNGKEAAKDDVVLSPFVELSIHVPQWTCYTVLGPSVVPTPEKAERRRTRVVEGNGFNPIWDETFDMPFDVVGDMLDLVFLRVTVREAEDEDRALAQYCISLKSLQPGYRHVPLHDAQLSQLLFSSVFIHSNIRPA